MIAAKKIDFKKFFDRVGDYSSFFLIGCFCSTSEHQQIEDMKNTLIAKGKIVTGDLIAKTTCFQLGIKVELKPFEDIIDKTDCLLIMSCGIGTQTFRELYPMKPIYNTNDTLFLSSIEGDQHLDNRCSLCTICVLDKTGGICPTKKCPKGILNGPCGGCNNSKCEIDFNIDCVWISIYERMKTLNRLEEFCESIIPPKDWSASIRKRKLAVKDTK